MRLCLRKDSQFKYLKSTEKYVVLSFMSQMTIIKSRKNQFQFNILQSITLKYIKPIAISNWDARLLNNFSRSSNVAFFSISSISQLGYRSCPLNFKFQVAPYWWCGNFSAPAEAILTQHAAQSGLSQTDNCLAQWVVFCALTIDHPLSFTLFNNLFDKISKPLQSGKFPQDSLDFWWTKT